MSTHAPTTTIRAPVIVLGMHKSGTTLVAEMIHRGGTPMYAGEIDPRYDEGIKYERLLCQELNRHVLGRRPDDLESLKNWPLQPLSEHDLGRLSDEVGTQSWGFKDPRTIFTYPEWRRVFPDCINISVYRSHREVVRHFCKRKPWHLLRMRRALLSWLEYNERMLEHLREDKAAARRAVLVRYEDLMAQSEFLSLLESSLGVSFFDARDPKMRRNKAQGRDSLRFKIATFGLSPRVAVLYQELEAQSLKVGEPQMNPAQRAPDEHRSEKAAT